MAATLTTQPASPASAYRPLWFEVTRTDPALSRIFWVHVVDAAIVTSLGNGLVVGDILVKHQAWSGAVPGIVGQTVNFLAGCAPYNGVWTILNAFTVAGDDYVVINAPDYGDFDPVWVESGRIWLNNYTVWCELRVYTDPVGTPQIVYMNGSPDLSGVVAFNVAPAIADYFSNEIADYVLPWTGTLAQHAHGLTALYYQVKFIEVYDVPGVLSAINPWEEGTEISDDTDNRVAVNAVHPYHSDLLTWEDADMGDFVVGTPTRKWLTYAPRLLTLGIDDSFRLHMLTNDGGQLNHELVVKQVNDDGTLTTLATELLDIGTDPVAAFSVAVGPADLAAYITLPSRYRVWLIDSEGDIASEVFEVIVDTTCKEVRRPLAWLSKLGGVDLFSFTGREIETSKATRTTVRKPMGRGTGYDWSERGNTSAPASTFLLSSAPLNAPTRAWIARDLGQATVSALKLSATQVTPIVLTSDSHIAANTAGLGKPLTIEYRRGTDNLVQQA